MASIVHKSKSSYSVVYYTNTGEKEKKQIWENGYTLEQATARKAEIERLHQLSQRVVGDITVEMLFQKWLPWRASTHHWKGKTVSTNWCLVNNYILPVFGSRKVRQLTTMDMDMYLQKIGSMFTAQSVRAGSPEKISSSTMHTIYTLIKGALDKAQVWGFISQNPMAGAMEAPKVTQKERPIWE